MFYSLLLISIFFFPDASSFFDTIHLGELDGCIICLITLNGLFVYLILLCVGLCKTLFCKPLRNVFFFLINKAFKLASGFSNQKNKFTLC